MIVELVEDWLQERGVGRDVDVQRRRLHALTGEMVLEFGDPIHCAGRDADIGGIDRSDLDRRIDGCDGSSEFFFAK